MGLLGFEPRSSAPKAPRITKLPYNPMVVLLGFEPRYPDPKSGIIDQLDHRTIGANAKICTWNLPLTGRMLCLIKLRWHMMEPRTGFEPAIAYANRF